MAAKCSGRLGAGDVVGANGVLVGIRQRCARTDKRSIALLDQAELLRLESQRLTVVVDRLDPGKQLRVQDDGVALRGELRRVLRVDLLDGVVAVGGEQHVERALGLLEPGARSLERLDRVGERRWFGGPGDALDLRELVLHAQVERLGKIGARQTIERRHAVRQRAPLEQGIVPHRTATRA